MGLLSGFEWGPAAITYGFPDAPDQYATDYSDRNEPLLGFQPLGPEAQAVFETAFAVYAELVGITLTRADDSALADIKIAGSSAASPAYAYLPGTGDAAGDIWLDLDNDLLEPLRSGIVLPGSYVWHLVLHEAGHALGLKHGHSAEFGAPALSADVDGMENTLMTYRSYVGDPVAGAYTNSPGSYAQSPMALDIAALQQLYGANYQTAAGDTLYTIDPDTGEVSRDGVGLGAGAANVVFRTLWDGGGHDHLDLSNATRAVLIDLAPGAGVDLDLGGPAQAATLSGGIWPDMDLRLSLLHNNDPRALIEEATGGSGDDILIGHNGATTLRGGDGADTLTGRLGADVFTGQIAELAGDRITDFSADDRLHVSDAQLSVADLALVRLGADALLFLADGVTLALEQLPVEEVLSVITTDGTGTDLRFAVAGDIALGDGGQRFIATGSEDLLVLGGAGADALTLGAGDDLAQGGAGADVIRGGAGDDTLIGGVGADVLSGGTGADLFVFVAGEESGALVVDTIEDFETGVDRLSLIGFDQSIPLALTETPLGALLALSAQHLIQFTGGLPDLAVDVSGAQASFGQLGATGAVRLTDGSDRIILSGATDYDVQGLAGADAISAGAGNDTLDGGAGADVLSGAAGDDLLIGGSGADVLTGGAGADLFRFDLTNPEAALTIDQITDFDPAVDRLQLIGTSGPIDRALTPFGEGALLTLSAQHLILFDTLAAIDALPENSVLYL